MNIIELVKDRLDANFLNNAAGATGLDVDRTRKTAGAAIPSILAAIMGAGSTPAGRTAVGEALRNQDPGMSDTLSTTAGAGQQQSLIDSGTRMLSSMLGESKFNGLSGAISSFGGIGEGAARSLLGMLTPVVMGVLGREQRSRSLGVDGVMDMLQSQKAQITSALPAGVADSLRKTGLLGGAGYVERPTPKTVDTASRRTPPPAARPTESHRGRNWGLIAVGVAALAVVLWGINRNRGPETEPAQQTARPAVEAPPRTQAPAAGAAGASALVVGNVDVGSEFNSIVDELSATMRGVSNEATAEAAMPQLTRLDAQLDMLAPLVDRLPSSAKPTFTDMAQARVDDLENEVERVRSMTNVPDTVKQTVAAVGSKLADMAA